MADLDYLIGQLDEAYTSWRQARSVLTEAEVRHKRAWLTARARSSSKSERAKDRDADAVTVESWAAFCAAESGELVAREWLRAVRDKLSAEQTRQRVLGSVGL